MCCTKLWLGKDSQKYLKAEALRRNGLPIDQSKNYAEYWIGTHPNGPSKIIKNSKEVLLSDKIDRQLSNLFKILSINKPLSIQLHQDKHDAEILHKFFHKNYKNDNNKPELFISLSDFELHFGFVSLDKAV